MGLYAPTAVMFTILAPLRHPTFARFFAGQTFSLLGDFVFVVALAWQVIQMGGSATVELGIIFTIYSTFQVALLILGGTVVDRFQRRKIVVTADLFQGIVVGVITALTYLNMLTFQHLYLLGALFGVATAFSLPALSAFLPETVPQEALQPANSLYQATRTLTGIAGPALGALLIASSGTYVAFLFDSVTFLVAALLLATAQLSSSEMLARPMANASMVTSIREGFHYVRAVPWLWITILVFTIVNAAEAGPRNVILPVFVGVELGAREIGIGLILSAQAIGSLVGYLAPSFAPKITRRGLIAYLMTALMGISIALLYYATDLLQVLVLSAARGVTVAVFALMWETSLMQFVDEKVRGRVFSLDMFGSFALLPLSMAGAGIVSSVVGSRLVFLLGGGVIIVCGILGLLYGPANRFEKPCGQTT